MQTNTIEIRGQEHASAHDALGELNFSGDHAIGIGGRYFTVDEAQYRQLCDSGIHFALYGHHESTCRIICIPYN